MASKTLFKSAGRTLRAPKADTLNNAGGVAYNMESEHALAQLITKSCFNNTFYTTAAEQIDSIKKYADECSTEFLAKAAVYAHETARMRDTPAFLLALLTTRGDEGLALFDKAFTRVITSVKMLMNFVQIIRSGQVGRVSFGSAPKRTIRKWLASRSASWLFNGSAGANPSFGDILKMIRPKPENDEKRSFYGYMIGREHDINILPENVKSLELFKVAKKDGMKLPVPDLPFELIATLGLTDDEWVQVAHNLRWRALQKNLEKLNRHGVFKDSNNTKFVADKLRNPELIRKSGVLPYQLMTAYKYTENVPTEIRNALQETMEVATENVPTFDVDVAMLIDVSRSMTDSAITGSRPGATSKTTCVEVASLMGATVLRRNKNAMLLPFDTNVYVKHDINPFDSVVTNAQRLAKFGGGGTDCAAPLRTLNSLNDKKPKLLIMVSDNESWHLNGGSYYRISQSPYHRQMYRIPEGATTLAAEWAVYKRRVPDAKLVCVDLVPNTTTQVKDGDSILNVSGWNDSVWDVIRNFASFGSSSYTDRINSITL